jgi:hypothetical protein
MKWKLSRGKSRPTLLGLVASNAEALVLRATAAALKAVRNANDDLDRALLALPDACKMKGVGAATASGQLPRCIRVICSLTAAQRFSLSNPPTCFPS